MTCVRLKNLFRTSVTKEYSVKLFDFKYYTSNKVVYLASNGCFVYLVQDSALQVVVGSVLT